MADSQVDRLLQWQDGKTAGPWIVTLFPTNRCNMRCKVCWQRSGEEFSRTDETPDDRLLELVSECAEEGVREWCIIGGGEPLVRGELVMALCERIRSLDMNGVIQTNATLLPDKYLKHLMRIGWSRIHVSLDGPDREINDAIRDEGSFDKATATIRRLTELKREQRVDTPVVSLYTILTATNFDKIDGMVDLARDLGCAPGGVHLTTMVLQSEDGELLRLSEEHKAGLPEHIRRAMRRAARFGMENNFALYLQEEILADPNSMRHMPDPSSNGMRRAVCYEPWLGAAISARGHVGPCCAIPDVDQESINTKSFRDVWLGSYLRDVRERLLSGRALDYCARCPSILFAQSESLREQLRWRQMSFAQRLGFLVWKGGSSVRRYGPREAIRRGRQWRRIHRSR